MRKSLAWHWFIPRRSLIHTACHAILTAIRLQVRCPHSTFLHRASPFLAESYPAPNALPALYLTPMRVSLFSCFLYSYRCVARFLPLSSTRLPFNRAQSSCRYVALSLPLHCASRFSTARNLASCSCIARFLPLSHPRLPFQSLIIRLQVRCPLCTSLQRASPFSTIRNPATGPLPALYLTLSRVSLLKRSQNSYPRVACSPPLSTTHLPFQPLTIQLQVRHALSTSLRRASPFSQPLSYPATGPLPVLCLPPMRISFSTASCSATVMLPAVFFSPSPHLSSPLPSIWPLVRCPLSALL